MEIYSPFYSKKCEKMQNFIVKCVKFRNFAQVLLYIKKYIRDD